jgi:hypothetical protein
MIAQFLASDEIETSLLVKTGSQQEAMKLQKYMTDKLFLPDGSLKEFNGVLLAHWTIGKFYTICFEDDLEALEAAEQCIRDYVNQMNEDFSMGVEGPTGLNQGIPHGGPGKGCLPKPLYNPKAKAVPAKEKDDKDTEENLKKLRAAKKLLKNEGFSLVRENAAPEYFCRNPFTVEDLENYLHDDDGFSWDEVDCLIDHNREMISSMLEQGKSPEEVSADLDDSCLKDLEA